MPPRTGYRAPELEGNALIVRELTPHLRELRRTRVDFRDVVGNVARIALDAPAGSAAVCLAELFEDLD